jgi:hypothetical protein
VCRRPDIVNLRVNSAAASLRPVCAFLRCGWRNVVFDIAELWRRHNAAGSTTVREFGGSVIKRRMFRRSSDAVATSREAHRSLGSGLEGQHRQRGRGRRRLHRSERANFEVKIPSKDRQRQRSCLGQNPRTSYRRSRRKSCALIRWGTLEILRRRFPQNQNRKIVHSLSRESLVRFGCTPNCCRFQVLAG